MATIWRIFYPKQDDAKVSFCNDACLRAGEKKIEKKKTLSLNVVDYMLPTGTENM